MSTTDGLPDRDAAALDATPERTDSAPVPSRREYPERRTTTRPSGQGPPARGYP